MPKEDVRRATHHSSGVVELFLAKGVYEDTVIVFLSDNGGETSTFVGDSYIGQNNSPLRGDKATLYEGGMRSLSFIKAPGLAAGKYGGLLSQVDLYATLLEAAGASMPERPGFPSDSISFWGHLHGSQGGPKRQELVYLQETTNHREFTSSPPWSGTIVTNKWKLIVGEPGSTYDYFPIPDPDPTPGNLVNAKCYPGCLFDLEVDGVESTDVYSAHVDVAGKLLERIKFYNESYVKAYWPNFPGCDWNDQADPRHFSGVWTPYR